MTPPALIAVATPPARAAPPRQAARPARSSALRLPAQSWAAAVARRHVGQLLQAWRLTAVTDTAQLLASELVANAVKAAQEMGASALFPAGSAAVELSVRCRQASVRIEVRDPNPELPAVQQAGPLDEGGRGLLIVQALSGSWGCYPAAGGGKVVWGEIALSGSGAAGLLAAHAVYCQPVSAWTCGPGWPCGRSQPAGRPTESPSGCTSQRDGTRVCGRSQQDAGSWHRVPSK
jgi:anti-sigma regulatory factor (Ser/Thr protein kinase)